MKAGVTDDISRWIFYALLVCSAAVLVMFYFVGFDGTTVIGSQSYTDPANTDLLLWWMYILVGAGIVCVAVFTLAQFFALLKNDTKSALKSLGAIVLLVALFGVAYAMADATPMVINGALEDNALNLVLSDVCIYVQYVLFGLTALCTLISLAGLFKMQNKIKA